MKNFGIVLFSTLLLSTHSLAQDVSGVSVPLPELKRNGAITQLLVDGRPFIMLSGELHNSSASSIEYMEPIWDKLAAMNLNTVIGTVSWELVEPEEGNFDFTLVDAQIREARRRNLRLVLIWFGTWKNAGSTYVPLWVKTSPQRFPHSVVEEGRLPAPFSFMPRMPPLSPLGEESLAADAKAFRALMRHIREVDPQHTVIMMQVENESGLLGDSRDRSSLAEAAWSKPVPADLMDYFAKNKAALLPEMQEVWGRNGHKTSGTWAEVFGTDEWADEVFMAYYVGRYIGKVAEAGKAELNIPMYANAWLGPQPRMTLPGQWPSGGPVARVMDVWRAAAPAIDLLAPDIYVEDFKGTCALYARSGNPLFIPEARAITGNLFYALGQHSALGWAPFGVEDEAADSQLAQAYRVLGEMLPQLAEWQAAGNVAGVLVEGDEAETVSLGGYRVLISPPQRPRFFQPDPGQEAAGQAAPSKPVQGQPASGQTPTQPPASPFGLRGPDMRPFALVISTGPDEFLIVGSNLSASFIPDSPGPKNAAIGSIEEGRYEQGYWIPGRRLNGDEGRPSIPVGRRGESGKIGMLKIKLYRYE